MKILAKPDYVVSVCSVLNNDAPLVRNVIPQCMDTLSAAFRYFELVLVDNSSTDGTWAELLRLCALYPGLRLIRLSRKVRHDVALTAALDHVMGDFVITLNLGLDPIQLIPRALEILVDGTDVLVGRHSEYRGPWLRARLSSVSRRLAASILGVVMEPNTGSLMGFTRRAVNSLTRIRSKSRYLLYDSAAVGYEQRFFDYQQIPQPGAEVRNESFWYLTASRMQMVIAHSLLPLRIATALGLLASFANVLYLLYILLVVIVKRDLAEGWLTTSVTQSTMFLVLFLILAVLTEYIGRILEESKDNPLYFVQQEHASTVSTFDQQRINVISEGA